MEVAKLLYLHLDTCLRPVGLHFQQIVFAELELTALFTACAIARLLATQLCESSPKDIGQLRGFDSTHAIVWSCSPSARTAQIRRLWFKRQKPAERVVRGSPPDDPAAFLGGRQDQDRAGGAARR